MRPSQLPFILVVRAGRAHYLNTPGIQLLLHKVVQLAKDPLLLPAAPGVFSVLSEGL